MLTLLQRSKIGNRGPKKANLAIENRFKFQNFSHTSMNNNLGPSGSSVLPKYDTASWLMRKTIQCSTAILCKLILAFQHVEIHNHHLLFETLLSKTRKRPVVSVSNHNSTVDDPVIWAATISLKQAIQNNMRWTLGAKEIMFTGKLDSWFFGNGNVIPIVRGAGLNQEGVQIAIEKLKQGGWVHMFPEGKVNQSGTLLTPMRWGVGKLIQGGGNESGSPLVLPVYHIGLEKILPLKKHIPRLFKPIDIYFEKPMCFEETLRRHQEKNSPKEEIYIDITNQIQKRLIDIENRILHKVKPSNQS